ncbi:unnamed protein product, partial [Timema podura]|nr:unnamed protein product [Timema podura]
MLLGDLSLSDRNKIRNICTIDVHSRDVVAKLIAMKVDSSSAFLWQSQLRHRWDTRYKDCFCNICDAQFRYSHEYLGNTLRLVITPLTDRCYITLTQVGTISSTILAICTLPLLLNKTEVLGRGTDNNLLAIV